MFQVYMEVLGQDAGRKKSFVIPSQRGICFLLICVTSALAPSSVSQKTIRRNRHLLPHLRHLSTIKYSVVSISQEELPMNPKTATLFFGVVLICLTTAQLPAQDAQSTLSGTVTDSAGKVLSNAKVTVKNLSTGQSTETLADAAGLYSVSNLPAGDYEVSASVEGMGTVVGKVSLTAGSPQIAKPELDAPGRICNRQPQSLLKIYRTRHPPARPSLRSRTWDFPRPTSSPTPRSRPCSTSAPIC